MSINLIELTEKHITRSDIYMPRQSHFYPSEASVKYEDEHGETKIDGTCLRQSWYRLSGKYKPVAKEAYGQKIFALGKAVEVWLIEQWKEMGVWVANNVKFYDKEKNISGEVDCVLRDPNTGEVYCVECCSPGTLVLTGDYRLVPFESLALENTTVVSHTGQRNSIANIQIKDAQDVQLYRFRSKFDGLLGEFTSEHPILIGDVRVSRYVANSKARSYHLESTSFKKAADVVRGDYICIPKAKFGAAYSREFYHDRAFAEYDVLCDNSDWKFRVSPNRQILSMGAYASYKPIPATINNLAEFYWMLGLYCAEGSCSRSSVYFSLHQDETQIIERLRKGMKDIFGLDTVVASLKDSITGEPSKGVNVRICSQPLRELFKALVPGNTIDRTKKPNYGRILGHPELLQQILLGAWQGDGCSNGTNQYKITTAVSHLAFFYFQIAAHCGLHPRLSKYDQASQFNSEYIYAVEWGDGGSKGNVEPLVDGVDFWCYKVKAVEERRYTGPVYNLECTPDHTYTAGGIITHNCKSFYGYSATKEICGNQSQVGRPKTSQMLQSLIYVDQGLKHGLWKYVKMVYMARDSGATAEFDLSLVNDNGVMRPTINGEIDYRFTMNDIYARYAQLAIACENDTPPPRDFARAWDARTVEKMYAVGEVAKTTYEKWKRSPMKNPVGDWQCRYCGYREVCYGEHKDIP